MRETAAELAFRRQFAAARALREAREPAWLGRLRGEAFEAFAAQGLPTTRHEDWRFTSLAKLEPIEFAAADSRPVSAATPAKPRIETGPSHRLVFVNGTFAPALSEVGALPSGCRVGPISEVLASDPGAVERALAASFDAKTRPMAALASALAGDGVFVEVARGRSLELPVHALFVQSGAGAPIATHVRSLLVAGEGSHARVVEHHVGDSAPTDVTNALTEIHLARDARLDHVLVQDLPATANAFAAVLTRQAASSQLGLHSLSLGAAQARIELESRLEGEGADLQMNGLYLGRGTQHPDHHTTIDHAAPRTNSRELFKGILDDRAHGVFHGRIHVRPHSQKINADQTNRALLLSDRATINTKPQLEIYADDVKCSHGATIGQLDEAQLFYLRARGLDLAAARALLTWAFASEVIERVPSETLRASLEHVLLGWLPLESRS
jgi:Fe-S cluster assembly protein SufD